MIAGCYARKSTDEGDRSADAKSITRQTDHSRAFVARHSGTFLDDCIFSDDGISGAEYEKRPGLQALLAALAPKPKFDTLVVSEVSRLGRDTVMNLMVIKRLRDAGVTIYSYLDGREVTLDDEQGELNAFLQSMLASGERRKAAQRSTDKYTQLARTGYVTGGKTFGYTNVRGNGHVDRTINDVESTVVSQIFTRFDQGQGLKKIAAMLNAANLPAPRPSKSSQPAWSPSTIKAILTRELYAGRVVSGKRKKRDKAGRHKVTKRPQSEWIIVARPDLQIIPDALWNRVQRRLADNAAAYLRDAKTGQLCGRPLGSAPMLNYLLSGLGTCGACGGSMAIRTSGGLPRRAWLECLTHRSKGARACSNTLRVALKPTEEAILSKMEQDLLRPEVLVAAIQRVLAKLTPSPAALEAERSRIKAQITTAERELATLGAAVAQGGPLQTLLEQIRDREKVLSGLRTTVTQLDHQEALIQLDPPALEAKLRGKLQDFTGLRQRHPAAARSLLRKVISGRITFTPVTGTDRAYYRVEWLGCFGALLAEELEALSPARPTSASAGFIGGDPGGIRHLWPRGKSRTCARRLTRGAQQRACAETYPRS
jgi:DNA invertase Pin-like site-specific DNA recombinase